MIVKDTKLNKKISKLWLVDYKLWPIWSSQNLTTVNNRMKILSQGHSFIQKMQDFCTKMKFPPLYMIFRGIGASQHYLVGFLSLLSPQARGASVMSLQFQSVCNGICDEISGPRLRSYQAIFTDQGHINKVIPVSECLKLFFNKIFGKC